MTRRKRRIELRAHAKRRLVERCGLVLNHKLYLELVEKLRAGKFKFVDRQSPHVNRYLAVIDGREMILVYDKHLRTLRTVLYADQYFARKPAPPAEQGSA
jgi:hypothetical protein